MEFLLLGTTYSATVIDEFNSELTDIFMNYFKEKIYSPELNAVILLFICGSVDAYKKRKKYYPQKRVFLAYIMLDLDLVMSANRAEIKRHYFKGFNQLYPILQRYKKKIKDLKFDEFKKDLDALLTQLQEAI